MRSLGPLATLLFWLGPINVMIGLFNLLPGFPLDGGRVLRAVLWRATGSLELATRWATFAGQAIGLLLVFAGICMSFGVRVPLFGTGLVSGLWLVFLGWFLASAAAASYRQTLLTALLEGVPVRQLMRRDVEVVPPELPLSRFVDELLMRSDQRGFPVARGAQLVGMVCLEDVRKVNRQDWERVRVSDVMTPAAALEVVEPEAEVVQALQALGRRDVEQLPVVRDGQLLGVIRRRDIMRWLELQSPNPTGRATPLAA
jgi:CBS domain-containing protein